MERDCRNCTYYQYTPKETSSPYGEEWCGLKKTDFAGDYLACNDYSEAQSLLLEITNAQMKVINIIENNLDIKFIGKNKGEARDFIRENIDKSKQCASRAFSPNEMMIGCHGVVIDKADFYQCLVPNQ